MKREKIWNILGIIIGAAMIIVGIFFFFKTEDLSFGASVSSASFGGDFYTYIHDATRTAANNLRTIAHYLDFIGKILSIIMCGGGFLSVIHFAKKCSEGELSQPTATSIEAVKSASDIITLTSGTGVPENDVNAGEQS